MISLLFSFFPANASELEARVTELLPTVETTAGRPFQRAVPIETLNETTLVSWLDEALATEAERNAQSDRIFTLLGLIGPDDELEALSRDALINQAAAFYDPMKATMYLVDRPSNAVDFGRDAVLVHELTHALDDQSYALQARLEAAPTLDATMAVSAVVEGSASVVMTRYMADQMKAGVIGLGDLLKYAKSEKASMQEFASMPPVVTVTLVAPYIAGMNLLLKGAPSAQMVSMTTQDYGQRLAATMDRPPVSMEQILHPEKYWDSFEAPLPIDDAAITGVLSRFGTVEATDTVGELITTLVVRKIKGVPGANGDASGFVDKASSGWGNDRFYLLDQGRGVWVTTWDSADDRDEFTRAYRKLHPKAMMLDVGEASTVISFGLSAADTQTLREGLPAVLGAIHE